VTVPLALPLWPDVIVIQAVALDVVHEQPVRVETLTDSRPPLAPMLPRVLLRLNTHGAAA
jgi:hypothetical protein